MAFTSGFLPFKGRIEEGMGLRLRISGQYVARTRSYGPRPSSLNLPLGGEGIYQWRCRKCYCLVLQTPQFYKTNKLSVAHES